jgi:hypothetical protein
MRPNCSIVISSVWGNLAALRERLQNSEETMCYFILKSWQKRLPDLKDQSSKTGDNFIMSPEGFKTPTMRAAYIAQVSHPKGTHCAS